MNLSLSSLDRFRDAGLLVLRLVLGLTFAHYGWAKMAGGVDAWRGTGSAMETFGIDFGFVAWGLAATLAELVGGLLLAVGWLSRLSALFLFFTMVVATATKVGAYSPENLGSMIGLYYPLTAGAVCFALIFLGPGRFAIERPAAAPAKPKA
jgi:putative oxidoreductase